MIKEMCGGRAATHPAYTLTCCPSDDFMVLSGSACVSQGPPKQELESTQEYLRNNTSVRTMLGERGIKPEELPADHKNDE